MIDTQELIKLSSYFSIIHHVKGRIRLRVSLKIKELKNDKNLNIEDIIDLKNRIDGIKDIKINKLVGSITIEYDNAIFPYELWEDLINQKNLDKIVELLNGLYKKLEGGN